MKTNTKVTIYHRTVVSLSPIYTRFVIDNVMWQGGRGSSLNRGLTESNDLKCYIPYENDNLKNVLIEIGDYIVRGEINENITSKRDLANYDFYTITSKELRDYGSERMKHLQIGAK